VSNAVGFAMAARKERELFDPGAQPGQSVFDHFVYCIAGDGDMQEGVASEASSLAATQELGNLIVIYDDNHISIEGDTVIALTEDVAARYAAYGWHVQHVDFTNDGRGYEEKIDDLFTAIEAAKAVTDRPSFIKVTTIIGWPLPTLAGSEKVHGAKIGAEEIAGLKTRLGFDPAQNFEVADEVIAHTRTNAANRAATFRQEWDRKFASWAVKNPASKDLLDRIRAHQLPADLDDSIPVFPAGKKSTRAASGEVVTALADAMPELWGGSADLAGSNLTTMKGQPSFLPASRASKDWTPAPNGRTLHFGIREHAMGGILNALNSCLTRAYGGTFLVFSDYMRPPIRVAALSKIPSVFVFTHDSIGVGEDGPTHQPVEHVAALRVLPGLDVIRPSDANEVSEAWKLILGITDHPVALILSRQDLTIFDRSPGSGVAAVSEMSKGAYTLIDSSTTSPQAVIVATGSEVEIAVQARLTLEADGIPTRVVAAPCLEWYAAQSESYKEELLPPDTVKVSIEAGVTYGWSEILGDKGIKIGIDHYGASAAAPLLYTNFGITADRVVDEVKNALSSPDPGTPRRARSPRDE